MQKKTIFLVGCALFGGGLLVVAAVAVLVGISFYGVSSSEVTEHQERRLVTVDRLKDHIAIPGDRALCESYLAKRNLGGSIEVEYMYDTDKDPDAEYFFYLSSETETSDTVELAKESFSDLIAAFKLGASFASGRELEEDQSLFSLGDDHFAVLVKDDGEVVGNMVVARKGTVVYSLILLGFAFEDREPLEALLRPAME